MVPAPRVRRRLSCPRNGAQGINLTNGPSVASGKADPARCEATAMIGYRKVDEATRDKVVASGAMAGHGGA